MGFDIEAAPGGGLKYGMTDAAWGSLAEKFAAAHGKPNSPLAAHATLLSWVGDKAPCHPHADRAKAYARMKRLATAEGFDEIPAAREAGWAWQLAHARWRKLRKSAAAGCERVLVGGKS